MHGFVQLSGDYYINMNNGLSIGYTYSQENEDTIFLSEGYYNPDASWTIEPELGIDVQCKIGKRHILTMLPYHHFSNRKISHGYWQIWQDNEPVSEGECIQNCGYWGLRLSYFFTLKRAQTN
ncbi:MAG: hypothetical protein SH856_06150 [Flavobacteriales bacterium]|nr:hypothetical protein [Flavobacteriales bacterium]